jgi:Siphovirus Gp157
MEAAMSTLMQRRQQLVDADPDLAGDEAELIHLLGDNSEGADALEVLHRLVRAAITASLRAVEADHLIERLVARKARYERRETYLRESILLALQALDLPRLQMADATASRKRLPPKPIVTDEEKLDQRFIRTSVRTAPNMTAIREALEAGEVVPGVEMSNGAETIQITIG